MTGGLLATAPFRWAGDFAKLGTLMDVLMEKRMGGSKLTAEQSAGLSAWIDALPAPAPTPNVGSEAAAAGKALFDSGELSCATCHSGPHLTNNANEKVGTGGPWQVPSLIGVSARLPLMHDGCAATLADCFGPCGGGDLHGKTSQLTAQELSTLIAYLSTL